LGLNKEAGALGRVPLLATLEPSKLKLLAFTSELISYRDGEIVFRAGEPPDGVYVIIEGEVEFLAETERGEVPAGVLGVNQLVGELGVITDSPRSATIRARGEARALRIGNEMFLRLITENPELALAVMRQLSEKLQRTHRHVEELEGRLLGGS